MTAAEVLARAEARARTVHLSIQATKLLVGAAILMAVYMLGRHQQRLSDEEAALKVRLAANAAALDSASKAITIATAKRDTTKLAARHAVARSTALAPHTDSAERRVVIVSPTDSLVRVDSGIPVAIPSAVTEALRALRVQRTADSLAIVKLVADNAQADRQIALFVRKDSLHVERETLLEHEVGIAHKSGFWSGVRTTLLVGGGVVLVRAVLRH